MFSLPMKNVVGTIYQAPDQRLFAKRPVKSERIEGHSPTIRRRPGSKVQSFLVKLALYQLRVHKLVSELPYCDNHTSEMDKGAEQYRLSLRPSCRLGFFRFLRWGQIKSMPRLASRSRKGSESAARS